ncbi:MAG: hypothetical protein ABSH05_18405 [Bryobacteraceae bacterium]|jgi:hypothetical protein
MQISRRDLLISSGAALQERVPANPAGQPSWWTRLRRCAQHNFNEYDPQILDIPSWIEYWKSLRLNALVLSAGGFIAFYPTKLRDHHRSQFLGSRDLFGEYCRAAKQAGIRVIARVETNWAHEEVLKSRPEWFERTADGKPVPNVETPYAFHTCLFSTYHEEQVPAIIREITALFDVDGVFTNSWPSTGAPVPCHREICRRLGAGSKEELLEKHRRRILDLCGRIKGAAREKRPDCVYNVNIQDGIRAVQSIKALAEIGDWLTADHQGRTGDTPIWDCAQQGRVAYASMCGKPVTNVVTGNASTWRHTSRGDSEITAWLAQTTASGMIPWYVWAQIPRTSAGRKPGAASTSGSRDTSRTFSTAGRSPTWGSCTRSG